MQPTIVNYFLYPIKSTHGFEQKVLTFDENGLVSDRGFALIDEYNVVVTARKIPKLVTLSVTIDSESIWFSSLGNTDKPNTTKVLFKSLNSVGEVTVTYFKKPKNVILLNSEAIEEWTSEHLGQKLRLVKSLPHVKGAAPSHFVDANSILLVNSSSFDSLNLGPQTSNLISFRGNIIIKAQPWIERKWTSIKIGSVNFRVVKECGRCVMVGVNAENGEYNPSFIKTFKTALNGDFNFGMYLEPLNSGAIDHNSVVVPSLK